MMFTNKRFCLILPKNMRLSKIKAAGIQIINNKPSITVKPKRYSVSRYLIILFLVSRAASPRWPSSKSAIPAKLYRTPKTIPGTMKSKDQHNSLNKVNVLIHKYGAKISHALRQDTKTRERSEEHT